MRLRLIRNRTYVHDRKGCDGNWICLQTSEWERHATLIISEIDSEFKSGVTESSQCNISILDKINGKCPYNDNKRKDDATIKNVVCHWLATKQ